MIRAITGTVILSALVAAPEFSQHWDGQAPDASGSVSFSDAIQKQLGLKLEVHKRPKQVLFIDHMEEKPTDN